MCWSGCYRRRTYVSHSIYPICILRLAEMVRRKATSLTSFHWNMVTWWMNSSLSSIFPRVEEKQQYSSIDVSHRWSSWNGVAQTRTPQEESARLKNIKFWIKVLFRFWMFSFDYYRFRLFHLCVYCNAFFQVTRVDLQVMPCTTPCLSASYDPFPILQYVPLTCK